MTRIVVLPEVLAYQNKALSNHSPLPQQLSPNPQSPPLAQLPAHPVNTYNPIDFEQILNSLTGIDG
jgi:hypothetical protein